MVDVENGNDIIYCSDMSCEHIPQQYDYETECNAYYLTNYSFYVNANNTYFLKDDLWNSKILVKADKMGEKQEKITSLDNIQNINDEIYFQNYYICCYVNSFGIDTIINDDGDEVQIVGDNLEKAKYGIVVVDLENGETKELYFSEEYNNFINRMYYSKGQIYFLHSYSDEKTNDVNQLNYDLVKCDIETGETSIVKSFNKIDRFSFSRNCLIYTDENENGYIYCFENQKTININEPVINISSSYEEIIYQTENEFCLYDINSEKVIERVSYPENVFQVVYTTKNSVYLHVIENSLLYYAYMSKEDFLNGDYEKMIIWGNKND